MAGRDIVVTVARSLGLLDASGNLLPLDSLMVVDLAVALEAEIGVEIPAMSLTPEAFESLDAIGDLVEGLTKSERTGVA
jgi:acyl carrier protein